MLKLVTGLPGAYKTAFTLDHFLFDEKLKNRPRFATPINGLDYEKHNITPINDLTDWMSCPDGSVFFIDEAQQYLRPRKKEGDLPIWISAFETHRHKGMDFYATTQNPMLLDVHFRRLVGEHIHNFRFSGAKRVARRLWQRCIDDPNDFHALKEAQITHSKVNKRVFDEYESTALDTHKFKIPTKLLFWGAFISIMFGGAIYLGYPIFSRWFSVTQTASLPTDKPKTSSLTVVNSTQQPTNIQPVDSKEHVLTAADLQPVTPLAPWSAPMYKNSIQIKSVPQFSGCIATPTRCSCYTQQGTSLAVDRQTCNAVIQNNDMPFNPFKPDSESRPYVPQNEPEQLAQRNDAVIVGQEELKAIEARNKTIDDTWQNASPSLSKSQPSSTSRQL
jgi:zona occludens toxin